MTPPAHLFSPYALRGVTLANRIVVSPMCQYSAIDGFLNDWHFVHLGTRAIGGAGLVLSEATAVSPEGRISPRDLGIWSDDHIPGLAKAVSFINDHGSAAGIQLAHAGRKSSMSPPWEQPRHLSEAEGGWAKVLAPSAIAFSESNAFPIALDRIGIARIQNDFLSATERSLAAGFQVIELHAAHGYLFHQFLSPLSNRRTDEYGGSFENRVRFLMETVQLIRTVWPASLPLLVRLSATDWLEFDEESHAGGSGWTIEETIRLGQLLRNSGVDLLDVSSGGNVANPTIPVGPGYQTQFAARLRKEADIATGAVGLITSPEQADHIIRSGQADLVLLARELLRNPYWPMQAAQTLRHDIPWPVQYVRAAGGRKSIREAFSTAN